MSSIYWDNAQVYKHNNKDWEVSKLGIELIYTLTEVFQEVFLTS